MEQVFGLVVHAGPFLDQHSSRHHHHYSHTPSLPPSPPTVGAQVPLALTHTYTLPFHTHLSRLPHGALLIQSPTPLPPSLPLVLTPGTRCHEEDLGDDGNDLATDQGGSLRGAAGKRLGLGLGPRGGELGLVRQRVHAVEGLGAGQGEEGQEEEEGEVLEHGAGLACVVCFCCVVVMGGVKWKEGVK